ncbi:MAG: class I SAM-dependent methyltransferase [Candidatus Heimdallarchaeota archaeon]
MRRSKSGFRPTKRFSDKARFYHIYRPRYPIKVLKLLKAEIGLKPSWIIADLGSGTGILSKVFLKNGNTVFCVEPNNEMRKIAESNLAGYGEQFKNINGTAESTTLKNRSVNLITAGQAFHWFEVEPAKDEFKRILEPPGYVFLAWNSRDQNSSLFMREIEELIIRFGTDYKEVARTSGEDDPVSILFSPNSYKKVTLPTHQIFDYLGLEGRIRTVSYLPSEPHPRFSDLIQELKSIFKRNQIDGKVKFEYKTELYLGQLF